MEIQELLNEANNLPNVPDVVRELVIKLNDEDADYGEIADKVAKDQTLSLKILRLVNSAHFGLTRDVGSIDEAVVILGMERLKLLVIASGFSGSVKEVDGLDLKQFWNEAFLVGALARWFADHTDTIQSDNAFTVGLIHNIGRLLLHLAQPNRAKAIQALIEQDGVSRSDAEIERLGFTSPEAAQGLLELWKFPDDIGTAVRHHKSPLNADPVSRAACMVNLACYINACRRREETVEQAIEGFPHQIAEAAGLEATIIDKLDEVMTLESGLEGLND